MLLTFFVVASLCQLVCRLSKHDASNLLLKYGLNAKGSFRYEKDFWNFYSLSMEAFLSFVQLSGMEH